MRLSPVIRKLLRPFLSRFFTKTLATATCSFTAAVFSFAFIPAAQAEEEAAEVLNPDKTSQVSELIKEDKTWSKFDNFREFDINKPIMGGGEDFAISDKSTTTDTGDLFWVWEKDGNDNYNFKLFVKNSDPSLDEYKTTNEYKGETINVKFKSLYDLKNNSSKRHSFDFKHGGRGKTTLVHEQKGDNSERQNGVDIWLVGNGEGPQCNDSSYTGKTFEPNKWYPSDDGQLRIIQSRKYTFNDGYIDDVVAGKKASKDQIPMYHEAGSSSKTGIAGGAIFITNVDENGNKKDGLPNGMESGMFQDDKFVIEADFINNGLEGIDEKEHANNMSGIEPGAKRVSNPHGGAIYTSLGVNIKSIKGDFIGNFIETNSKGYGGAIYNMGRIDEMESNFLFNYVKSTNKGAYSANAGAICNGKESSDPDPVGGYIGSLKGYFIGNYVSNEAAGKDTLGGAIINYGTIGSLDGVFIGNYNSSKQTANSGVIRNYAQNYWMATIGEEINADRSNLTPNKTVFNGIFIGNYSRGEVGDAFAGVMRNNGNINGRIEGVYVGNYAMTEGTLVTGDTNPDGQNGGQVGAYNYLKWSKDNNQYVIGNSGMAYGGVFYNDIKLEDNQASGKPYIGNIKATFVDNYAFSKYGEAFGGAIFNQDAEIQNIDSDFQGNYTKSDYFIARAGALYNDTNEAGKNHSTKDEEGNKTKEPYIGTIRQIGEFTDAGEVKRVAIFDKNYAQGKMAQGGAVYVSNDSAIEEVAARFSGNIVRSKVNEGDSDFYYHLQDTVEGNKALFDPEKLVSKGLLTPTAQGGALYVADGGSTQNIYGQFEGNYAETNGVGTKTKIKVDEHGDHVYADADGNQYTFVQVDDNNNKIYADVAGNQIVFNEAGEQLGEDGAPIDDADPKKATEFKISMNEVETAQGGAIYVARAGTMEVKSDDGKTQVNEKGEPLTQAKKNIQNIEANFVGNYVKNQGVTELNEVATIAQGGAIYVYDNGIVQNIIGDFKENKALGHSQGSSTETVQGGAIYVSGGGQIAEIGASDLYAKFSENLVEANGRGYQRIGTEEKEVVQEDGTTEKVEVEVVSNFGSLKEQKVEGGAIFISSDTVTVTDDATGESTEVLQKGSIQDVYADFKQNQVVVSTDGLNKALKERTARGGAIYISHEGEIGKIAGSGDEGSGFNENSITVSGGAADAAAELTAQGGAIYVADSAKVNAIVANFTGNEINTSDSTGNELERAGGGAIYVDGNAVIGATVEDGIGGKGEGEKVKITDNRIIVGGKGENLERQYARGGAIFVGNAAVGEDLDPNQAGLIHSIYATISENKIEAHAEDDTKLKERIMRGGAIFLSDGGRIEFLYAGDGKRGLEDNSITVTGGSANGEATLKAGGGAMYVSESGGAEGIMAGFARNYINTVDAKGNETEWVRGGAIFLDQNGTIQSIGERGNEVEVKDNYLEVSGNGAKLKEQLVQGGAMYVSGTNKGDSKELPTVKTITDIHADIIGNYITAQKGDSQNLKTRQLEGGAIYLANRGYIGEIHQGSVGFVGNSVTLSKDVIADTEKVYGGAIYVADYGQIDVIDANFEGNSVSNSKHEAAAKMEDGALKSDKHAKGGAIYLAQNGRIGKIGTEETMYSQNQAIGTGEVRAGAVFVSKAEVEQIFGTFLRNSAINTAGEEDGTEAEKLLAAEGRLLTYGGAMRFDQSTIFSLDADFVQNYTNGTGGGLSLTDKGIIYEVHGDFLGNISKVNAGAVDAMGNIGKRGYVVTDDDQPLRSDFENARYDDENEFLLERDSTDTLRYDPSGKDAESRRYKNRQGRGEYDGSFTGGFINCNFLYNRVTGDDGVLDNTDGHYFRGAGIYTDKDLFITVDGEEVIMSGNAIVNADKSMTRSAIYVDNMRYNPSEEDYQSIVVYLVAQNDGILRIDDNIRGHADTEHGLLLRLRGYADRHFNKNYRDDSGFIILNNRVEQTYTVMDDVTLYIGYKPRTFDDTEYFIKYGKNNEGKTIAFEDVKIGDEWQKNIIMKDAQGKDRVSFYLDEAGRASRDGKEISRSDKGEDTLEHHQSDIFRDSHMSVRSGTVALTESHYAIRTDDKGRFTDMLGEEADEVYTEYLFGSLIAYGADYNYGEYGTLDVDDSLYAEQGLDRKSVRTEYIGSSMVEDAKNSTKYFQFRKGSDEGLYATFEFGVSYNPTDVYTLAPKGKYYYKDMNGNYTEKSSWKDYTGEVHDYTLTDVPVERQMAKSDVLTVFAVWKDGKMDWQQASKGRVTLNGLSVQNAVNGWKYVKKSVFDDQQWGNEMPTDDEKDSVLHPDENHFNRDIYVQLINYMLVEETTDAAGNVVRTPVKDETTLEKFHQLFEESKEDAADDTNSGYHLLRLSDHFDLVHDATAYMKGSDVLADEIELATTVTKDDTLHIVGWRDHLAEWAEHEGSVSNDAIAVATADPKAELQETLSLYTGRKHFLLDQSVYYLNRNINLEPNPTEKHHDPTGSQMWGQFLTIEGKEKWRTLDLQGFNMLSLIIEDQEVRLQSFSLTGVQNNHMDNFGHLIFDTMEILDGLNFNSDPKGGLVVNNAGTGNGAVNENKMTVTGLTDINFTITTEGENTGVVHTATLGDGEMLSWVETKVHGSLVFDHSTQVTDKSSQLTVDAAGEDALLKASVVRIKGVVEHQDITHKGEDELKLKSENVTYTDDTKEKMAQTLPTWSLEKGVKGTDDVRESFTTNTYLNTTDDGVTATSQFKAFRDNSLTMEGGAFNLGEMWKHRLKLRSFNVNGGGVFVESSTIDLTNEVMGGIDACDAAGDHSDYAGNGDTSIKHDKGTAQGLIWLKGFKLEGTSEKEIVHVKFVDDGVGDAVKDGMGIANGAAKSGMRIMADGDYVYDWEVTYNDPEAENKDDLYAKNKVGVRGMYTFRRRGFTPEAQVGPVADLTGSYASMMQVYNYAFQHADMFADSVQRAQMDRVYENSYNVVTPVKATKNKNAVAPTPQRATPRPRPCTAKASLSSGLWFNTYASTEQMPLHNGPKVRLNMYGGLIGGDSDLTTHNNGWSSVWSLYGGYMGSTQRYDGVRIRQNGAAVGATGTFYRRNFYTALTANVGIAQATASGRAGHEDFDLLMGGIASRSGYNFVFDGGRYVLQPNLQVAFTMFNSTDYLNAGGARVSAKPRGVLQVHPFVKFIVNTDCTWKPYGTVGVVCNVLGKTKYSINGAALPSMSINPYVEYSIGAQYNWSGNTTIFGQITGRNGGRNGAELNAGVRWVW